jgi:hypothetical protein
VAGERVCPSSTLEHATTLLGVVGPDGRVHYVSPAPTLDDDFRRKVRDQGGAERRFRFAGTCVEDGCSQWTGSRCGVIDTVLGEVERSVDGELDTELRPCTVRRACRWFAQSGPAACRVCPLVTTDSRVG